MLQGLRRANVTNYMVVAIDRELETHLTTTGVNVFFINARVCVALTTQGAKGRVSSTMHIDSSV